MNTERLLDDQCRTVSSLIEMFEHASRVEIRTNVIDEKDGSLVGELIVSANRTSYNEPIIVGVEKRAVEIMQWDKAASDERLFGARE